MSGRPQKRCGIFKPGACRQEIWMWCRKISKGAAGALALGFLCGAPAFAATYSGTVEYPGSIYYKVVSENGRQSQGCKSAETGISYNSFTAVDNQVFQFYTDNRCSKAALAEIGGAELFPEGTTTAISIKEDGSWELKAAPKPVEGPGVTPAQSSSSKAKSSSSARPWGPAFGTSSSSTKVPVQEGKVTVAFLTPWTNTNAVLFVEGDSVSTMTAMDKYCGWFAAKVNPTANGLRVYFKQTIGTHYVGAEGYVDAEPTIANEIVLDSIVALGDTVWVQGFKNDVPALFSKFPGVLNDCPLKKLPVTVIDWLHGDKDDGSAEGMNGDPAFGTSADFGSGGCNSVRGMVQYNLGANGVPVPSDPFPEKCLRSDHLANWFLPEEVVINGKKYNNMTCRDLYLSLEDDGFWLAEVSKDRISKGNENNKGGMFLVDDFKYLNDDPDAPNPYFDWLSGSGGNHNFGFTVKIQAQFEYVEGQYFDFYGDDDVWVFIDNRLAVDIGGQHAQEKGAVLLDTIGPNTGNKLIPGKTYDFHIFYVERHVSSSNFRMHTSIDLQVEAAIFVKSDRQGDVKRYDVWQINKKNKLSCGYDPNNTEVDTTAGPSTFMLTGGNLAEPEILGVGTHYEGIVIMDDHTFSIDSAKIVENFTLAPGHYFLEITLKSDPSQTTKVEFVIPSYAIPSVAFATDSWKVLGKEVNGDTLQIGEWAYATYKVNITFFEEWAQVTNYNKKINLSFTNPNINILDSTGKKISYVNLDDKGRASFYIRANAEITGASLIAKGTAASASQWFNLSFKEPPIPHVKDAIIVDRNGDGRADSLFVSYDRSLKGESRLDSIQFAFGESFATTAKYKILGNGTDLIITAEDMGKSCSEENCGFGSRQFTGGNSSVYVGQMNSWFTYTKDNKSTRFNTEGEPIEDGVGPVVLKAVKKKLKDGNRELSVTLSEAITDESRKDFVNLLEMICMRAGVKETPENPTQESGDDNILILIYSPSKQDAIVPDNGDLVRLLAEGVETYDLKGNKPHKDNPWVTVTGDQELTNEAPGVIAVGEDPYGIIANKETTQPTLITNVNQDVQSIGDSLGVQGHLIDFDISKIMYEETQKDINALDAFIESRLGSTTSYDTLITGITEEEALDQLFKDIEAGIVGEAYGISEETVAGVVSGTITKENFKAKISKDEVKAITNLVNESVEASRDTVINIGSVSSTTQEDIFEAIRKGELDSELKKAGISKNVIESIKNGILDANKVDDFRSGNKSLVADSAVVLHYQTRYYSQFGEYVGGASKTIRCSDESVYGAGGCQANKGKLFLAWNMRSDDGRIVGTGVYIARLQMKIKVNGRTTLDQTRDKLMGVRRGKTTGLDLEF